MDAVWLHKESRKSNPKGFAVIETNSDGKHYLHYILKDHLGSWTTITDAEGTVEQELSFDAWGNLRDPNTWIRLWSDPIYEEPMFDRGYTGHEHMMAFGLINMNGRCYDPVMSSFLSVDAYVQSPDNSQNFNHYSYCLNNPLKYTDPSGWVLVGGMTPSNPFHDNWGQNFGEKIYTSTEVRQMLWTMDISIGIWMVGNEMHGSRGGDSNSGNDGDNASRFYDDQGRCLGSINNGNGKVYVLRAENVDVLKKRKDIKRFFKGKSSSINADEIYQYFIEIESSKENRQRMYEIVSADNGRGGTSDQNNREYGGYIKNGVVIPVDPGPVGDPRIQSELSIEIPFGYSSFHSHASGYIIERNRTDILDAWWRQLPSLTDITNAGDQVHYVFSRYNKCVCIYNSNGTQAILRERIFLNIGP